VKIDISTMARLMFATALLISTVGGAIWYLHSVSGYATYQIYTQDPVSLSMPRSNSTALTSERSKTSGWLVRVQ
jgi:hypothetical protein